MRRQRPSAAPRKLKTVGFKFSHVMTETYLVKVVEKAQSLLSDPYRLGEPVYVTGDRKNRRVIVNYTLGGDYNTNPRKISEMLRLKSGVRDVLQRTFPEFAVEVNVFPGVWDPEFKDTGHGFYRLARLGYRPPF
jgi:hypothetical protein